MDLSNVWAEKYRPKKLEDIALPKKVYNTFKSIIETGDCPNLLLHGAPGCGKTTSALVIANELNMETLFINASLEGKIDTIRTKIIDFATHSPIGEKRKKMIIFDEVDGSSTSQSFQPALRATIEKYNNVVYVFTCNYINRVIEPLRSRCAIITFDFHGNDRIEIEAKFYKSLLNILKKENVKVSNDKVLAQAIHQYYPDFRRLLNELQRYYHQNGQIDEGFLISESNFTQFIEQIAKLLANKDFSELRKLVANLDYIDDDLYSKIYDELITSKYLEPRSIPKAVIILGEYAYRNAFVADKEINFMAFLTTLMAECVFKKV